MQFAQEIINNSEMRSRLYKTFDSLRSRLTTSKLKTILLVSLISFTSLLVRQTLQVQHSCNPMIHWSGEFPAECQVAVNNSFDSFDDFNYPRQQELKTPKLANNKSNINNSSPKKLPRIAQANNTSQPNKITRDSQAFISETSQNNTETELKNIFVEKVETVAVAGIVAGAAFVAVSAPIQLVAIAALGVGVAVWQGIKAFF